MLFTYTFEALACVVVWLLLAMTLIGSAGLQLTHNQDSHCNDHHAITTSVKTWLLQACA
jgi:hypothetical protein